MRIGLDGRKVVGRARGCYFENKAYFTKKGLIKQTVLHEFYHHLVSAKGLHKQCRVEEREANNYPKKFLSGLDSPKIGKTKLTSK